MKNNKLRIITFIFVMIILFTQYTYQIQSQKPQYSGTLQVLKVGSGQLMPSVKKFEITTARYSSQQTINGELFKVFRAQPFNGCSPLSMPKTIDTQQYPYLMLVSGDQGNCGYRKKASMAQKSLARGIIIINDGQNQANQPYSIYTDNSFQIFLLNPDNAGQIGNLKQFLVKITYIEVPKQYQLQLWTSSMDMNSQELLIFFSNVYQTTPAIKQNLKIKPRFAIYSPTDVRNSQSQQQDKKMTLQSCACGSLCSPVVYGGTADVVIKQDFRRMMIWDQKILNVTKYFQYCIQFRTMCLISKSDKFSSDCWTNTFNSLPLDISNQAKQDIIDKIDRQVADTIQKCQNKYFQQAQLDKMKFHQMRQFPAIFLNRRKIEYSTVQDLKRTLCIQMNLLGKQGCDFRPKDLPDGGFWSLIIGFLIIIITVSVLSAISLFLLTKYRQSLRKQMNKEVKMQVSTAIEHYYSLSQTN